MNTQPDPILAALARIEAKQDAQLENQERMERDIRQIRRDTRRVSAVTGAAAGAVSGGIVATGIALLRAKLGI